jgi:hypothetical protein
MKKNVLKVVVSFSLMGTLVPSLAGTASANGDTNTEVGVKMSEVNEIKEVSKIVDMVSEQTEEKTGESISEQTRDSITKSIEEQLELANAKVNSIKLKKEVESNKFSVQSLGITDSEVVELYQVNLETAKSIYNLTLQTFEEDGYAAAEAYRLSIFYAFVKSGGPWDLKQFLGTKTKYLFKDTYKTGEYIGNHHYGYMGKAIGFTDYVLKLAAGMYQVYSGTSEWSYIFHYYDDPADQNAINDGIYDYNSGFEFEDYYA